MNDPNQAICANTEVAITDLRDLRLAESQLTIGVQYQHKVIARAVALGERNF